jgi:hypothetical protein
MREKGSLEKDGDREEQRLNVSQGYNRKERDRLTGKGGDREEEEERLNTIGKPETGETQRKRD